ncbi:NAD(P)H-dependent flavin oxidoreductase [Geodermatophilus sp. SYSU D01186]
MATTRFTELTGCSVPVQQAPMGAVSTPALVAAVAEAGGVGTVGAIGMTADQVVRAVDGVRARTAGVIAVNVLTEDVDEEVVTAAAERVRLLDFFWLTPRTRLVELAHAAGALVGWQVGSVGEARAAEDAGCDLVTVQGTEAGGHVRGAQPLRVLLDDVLGAVRVPVLAAGGIASGPALAAVLRAGAAGARIGTLFVATEESGAHPDYRRALVGASAGSTVVTGSFAVECPLCATSPRARVLRSAVERAARFDGEFVGTLRARGAEVPLPRGAGMPPIAAVSGSVDAMALYAGEGVGDVTAIRPAAEVVAEVATWADQALGSGVGESPRGDVVAPTQRGGSGSPSASTSPRGR